jgi:NADH pyrophosphatase NudC (nudix superfamily)
MEKLLSQLKSLYPQLRLSAGKSFVWSPETNEVFYPQSALATKDDQRPLWSLLHETGHALLGHTTYRADFELIRLEVAAWEKARELAAELKIRIDEDHIQDCLDTYRDWLYKRSICPQCGTKSIQQDDFIHYRCYNCHATWRVSPSRFARAYRKRKNVPQPGAVFRTELN